MKIAYVAVKGIPIGGGVESVTEQIGSKMVERGHEVIVYSSRDYGTIDCWYKGMKIKTVESINNRASHKLSICFKATYEVVKNRDVDLVHVHAVGPSLFSIFPRMVGIPTVVQAHGLEWKRDKWGIIGRSFFRLADFTAIFFPNKTTVVSKVQKKYYENRFGKKVIYIPNGVDPVKKMKPKWILTKRIEPNRYILFAARLVEEKGAHWLIEAYKRINTDMQLVIAGDAAHVEKYKSKLKRLAKEDSRIIFTGYLTGEPLAELFSNAYLFCLPSTIEGLPVALLEAMNYGNCCLASDIPENLEAIEKYGYTFKNRDMGHLKTMLEYLIHRPEKVEEKKESALVHVRQKYSWERIADQMEELYSSVIRS